MPVFSTISFISESPGSSVGAGVASSDGSAVGRSVKASVGSAVSAPGGRGFALSDGASGPGGGISPKLCFFEADLITSSVTVTIMAAAITAPAI